MTASRRPRKPPTREAMLLRMADLCSRSEQCEGDLRRKMLTAGLPGADIDAVIEYLTDHRYLDPLRFARAFAADKVRFAGWGRRKVKTALALKKIPAAIVAEALEAISPDDYREAFRKAVLAKARSLDLQSPDDRMKLTRHLLSRGFEPELLSRIKFPSARR